MSKRVLQIQIAAASLMIMLCVTVNAKETKLLTKDQGILGSMHRMGCRADWISVVMNESSILESELRSLPKGRLIIAPDNCRERPPGLVTRRSKRVLVSLTRQELVVQANQDLRARLNKSQEELNATLTDNTTLQNENNRLSNQVRYFERSNDWRRVLFHFLVTFVLGVVLTAAVGFFFWIRPLQQDLDLRKSENDRLTTRVKHLERILILNPDLSAPTFSVEHNGEMVNFRNTSYLYAGCPFCPEIHLKPHPDNLRQHLTKQHPHNQAKTA